MGDLCIAMEELLGDAGEAGGARVVTEGDFEALCRMEVTFKRKKGEYFACYEFGNALTPDSDQMIRGGGGRGGRWHTRRSPPPPRRGEAQSMESRAHRRIGPSRCCQGLGDGERGGGGLGEGHGMPAGDGDERRQRLD